MGNIREDIIRVTDLKRPEFGLRTPEEEIRYRCDGVAFTILSTLDGSSLDLPAFNLVPAPAEEDQAYYEENGENWFDPNTVLDFTLHEYYHRRT